MKEISNDQCISDVPILFVEDDANDILLFSRALSRSHLPAVAHFVRNSFEFQDYLLGKGKFSDRLLYPVPKLIMTDNKLCGESAAEIIRWVRCSEQFRSIPVVVLSSFVPPSEVEAMLGAGARAFLEKPIDFAGFCEIFRAAMKFANN